jgi:hypothetical protein
MRLYRFQQSDICDLIIDEYPSPSASDQLSSDQRLTLADINARLREQFLEWSIALNFEDAFNKSAGLSRPDEIYGRAIPQQQAQSVNENRFARSSLSAQNVEAFLELNLQTINYRKIYDIQKSQHILLAVLETRLRR